MEDSTSNELDWCGECGNPEDIIAFCNECDMILCVDCCNFHCHCEACTCKKDILPVTMVNEVFDKRKNMGG